METRKSLDMNPSDPDLLVLSLPYQRSDLGRL